MQTFSQEQDVTFFAVLETSIYNTYKEKSLSINFINADVYSKNAYVKFSLYYTISQLQLSEMKSSWTAIAKTYLH